MSKHNKGAIFLKITWTKGCDISMSMVTIK
jgi:hypothetical protein